jgi:hypothetical protein
MNPQTTPPKDASAKASGSWGRILLAIVGVLGAIAVSISAFMMSAPAITSVAKAAGINATIAWALVLAVDGLMLTGSVVLVTRKLAGQSMAYPAIVVGAGVLLSIICNALHAKAGGGHVVPLSSNAKMAVSAIPAVALALAFHLVADIAKEALSTHTKTVSVDASVDAPPERPKDTQADAPVERPRDTPRTPPAERPRTHARMAPRTPPATARSTAVDTRAKARELLKANPDMNGNELAAALKRKPAGSIRTMRGELLEELRDAGEIPSVRALGA